MTRIKAITLVLVAVLVLVIISVALVASELPSGAVLHLNRESSMNLEVGAAASSESSVIACDGCSGGGGTGG